MRITNFKQTGSAKFKELNSYLKENHGVKVTGFHSKSKLENVKLINESFKNSLPEVLDSIEKVDLVFIDGTFYDNSEINNRDMSEIPHPFIVESMELFKDLPSKEKAKITFIHLNHTNPLLDSTSNQRDKVLKKGFKIAEFKQIVEL